MARVNAVSLSAMNRFLCALLACASASWTPELKLKKHGDQSKVSQEWGPAIRATLKASLHAYADKAISSPKAAAKLLAQTAERLDAVVAVLDNRVFVDETFLEGPGAEDGMRHLRIVAGAARLDAGVPDVAYRFALHADDGAGGDDCRARAPELVVYKRRGYGSCGVLAPHAAFSPPPPPLTSTKRKGDDWEVRKAHAAAAAAARKWAGRRDAALWRGGATANWTAAPDRGDCVADALRAPLLALGPPFLADCEGACAFPRAALDACARGDTAAPPGAFDRLPAAEAGGDAAGELRDYKYLLSAPPARSLASYWMQGAVVLLADAPVVEWYYPAWKSTAGSGRPDQTLKFSSSVTSKSIRLIFGRIDCSRRVLEAQPTSLCQNIRLRAH